MPIGGSFTARTPVSPELTRGRPQALDEEARFSGGLNTVSAEDALGADQFRRGDNGRLTPFGAFIKRGGTQQTAAAFSANNVQNGYTWLESAGGVAVPMAVCNGTLFTSVPVASFPMVWTQRGGSPSISTSATPSFAQFLNASGTDSVYIADGGLLNRYTGTTLTTDIASTPSCTQLAVHNQRLWGCGDPSAPDSIWYSALNNGDTLGIGASGGGQIIVRTFGKQDVTGIMSVGTSLLIFHRGGISRLTGFGQSDVTVAPAGITGDVGTISPNAIVRVDTVAYFITLRGLYLATEQEVTAVNTPERPDPLSIILNNLSDAEIASVDMELNQATRELWISVPTYGVYIYHTILGAWSGPWIDGYLSPATKCLFTSVNVDGYPIIYRGDASGYVSLCDAPNVYLDNVTSAGTGGTAYTQALQLRRLYCNDPHISKAWRFAYILASLNGSSNSTLSWSTDTDSGTSNFGSSGAATWGAANTTWGTGTWGAIAQTSHRLDVGGSGYYIDLTISDDGTSATPSYSAARVLAYPLGRR